MNREMEWKRERERIEMNRQNNEREEREERERKGRQEYKVRIQK